MDPNATLVTVAFRGADPAGIGGSIPADGIYDVACTKIEAKQSGSRTTLWVTLTTEQGQDIYDYVNVPQLSDKEGAEKFFKRTLIAFGADAAKIAALKTGPDGIPLKVGMFLGKKLKIHFFAPNDEYKAQVTYILPSEYADAESGKIAFKRMDGTRKIQGAPSSRGNGATTASSKPADDLFSSSGMNGMGGNAADDLSALLG